MTNERGEAAVTITEQAGAHLPELLAKKAGAGDRYLRLVADPSGRVGLVLDTARQQDTVITVDGEPVLLLHPALSSAVKGAVLDYPETGNGRELTLSRG